MTFGSGAMQYPTWMPDGRRLLYGTAGGDVLRQAADGTGTAETMTAGGGLMPYGVSPDGAQAVIRTGIGNYDLALLSLAGGGGITPLLHTAASELNGEISPDGNWLAYESTESRSREVYVRPFPNIEAGRWQVSSGGGTRPLWARSGRELFYLVPRDDGTVWLIKS